MHIAFSPALGETIHMSAGRTRKPTTQLHFTATLKTLSDYEQVASGHVKLQVWSDIPGNGRHAGEWGETEFKPPALSQVDKSVLFSLDGVEPERSTSLTLDLSVPVAGHGQRFSFTYRIVYPNGEVKWLGHYGHNGTLVLDWRDSDPVVLDKDWTPTPENDSYRRDSDGHVVQDLQVARLSHPSDYIAYPVGENSFLNPKDSSLIVLVPRLSTHPVVVPPTLVFGATSSGSISFTPRGVIMMSGTPSLSFTACESPEEVELAVSRVINPCSSPRCRVVSYTPGILVLASGADKYPVQVALVPITSYSPVLHHELTLQSLASVISGKSPFFMFSSLHRVARFAEEESAKKITFAAGQSGGQFVLSPAHTLNHGDEQWQVGIMSPHSLPAAHRDGLPTPPPSPRLRPLPHLVSESPDPSLLSLPAAISSGEQPASPSSSSSQLIVHSNSALKHRGMLAMIGRVFMMLLNWIARLFQGRRVEVQPKRITDERTPLLQQEQPRVEVSASDTVNTEQQPSASTQPLRVPGISVDIDSGKTTILFQATHQSASFNVPIQFNGQNIGSNVRVQQLGDRLFVVELSSTVGGRLQIG
ncbi:hypothetical protein K438DRAFT_1094040 [Mycena galopus ATCC 62051]|nr:hypothetical protein K438DRAFT_1094040 [Mycena galopus ATCC 62051]